ncbi:hypothetical protein CRUP_019101 [Coryphaenoides rupestris]|nr:hypothetical protein CRUP_019101 [Coryphaenoides rupestris]
MADSIPLYPVRSGAKRISRHTSAKLARYSVDDDSSNLDEMPLMMSEEGFENEESDYQTLPRARLSQRPRGLGWFLLGGWRMLCALGCEEKYPRNAIKNQKYNIITFLPGVLYQQFKFFLNLYFLVVALSQFRDKEMNGQLYTKLTMRGKVQVKSSDILVGDLIIVDKNQRIPADMIFLRTSEKNGTCFIRTDQLDGETDWKLKVAVSCTQRLLAVGDLFSIRAYVHAQKPQLDIHSFEGNFTREDSDPQVHESLSIENTLWASTVVASGTVIGVVIYTGKETRSVLNTSSPQNKVSTTALVYPRSPRADTCAGIYREFSEIPGR